MTYIEKAISSANGKLAEIEYAAWNFQTDELDGCRAELEDAIQCLEEVKAGYCDDEFEEDTAFEIIEYYLTKKFL